MGNEVEPPRTRDYLNYQKEDTFCKEMAVTVELSELHYNLDKKVFPVRVERIDGFIKRVVSHELLRSILRLFLYPVLAGHLGENRMYDRLRRDFCCIMMGNDVFRW